MSTAEFLEPQHRGQIDPLALGRFVGNIINGMPEHPTHEDVECAREMARMGLLDALTDFDEEVVPEEDVWGVNQGYQNN